MRALLSVFPEISLHLQATESCRTEMELMFLCSLMPEVFLIDHGVGI